MTFCALVGVIEICVLPLCAIPTTGIVARDRNGAHVENNFLMVGRPFLMPSKAIQQSLRGAFPILPILCLILLGV